MSQHPETLPMKLYSKHPVFPYTHVNHIRVAGGKSALWGEVTPLYFFSVDWYYTSMSGGSW